MEIEQTGLPGVVILTPRVFRDARGFFTESYNRATLRDCGIDTDFVQDNHSHSTRDTLRGLHFQLPPAAQEKLVRVVRGAIWDVAVDIRKGSPFFGRWAAVELTAENFRQLYIPAGFAHGFCVLSVEADVLYKASQVYERSLERGIRWDEPALGIEWPVSQPILSERDRTAPTLEDYLQNAPFEYLG